jgi:hypothetical protein
MPSNVHPTLLAENLTDFDIIKREDESGYLLYFSKDALKRLHGFPILPAPPPGTGGGPGFCVVGTSDLKSVNDCGKKNLPRYTVTIQNVTKTFEGVSITCAGENCFIFYDKEVNTM